MVFACKVHHCRRLKITLQHGYVQTKPPYQSVIETFFSNTYCSHVFQTEFFLTVLVVAVHLNRANSYCMSRSYVYAADLNLPAPSKGRR